MWRPIAWAGVAFQAVALIAVVSVQEWSGAWAIGGFLALTVAFLAAQDKVADLLDFLVVVGTTINAVGWGWDLFDRYIWYDEIVHLFTTFAVTAALGHYFCTAGWIAFRPSSLAFFISIVNLAFGLGILWEIAEALFLDLEWLDTASDILLDTIGGVGAALLFSWLLSRPKQTATKANPTS